MASLPSLRPVVRVDQSKKEWADLRNGATYAHLRTERTLQEFGDKLDADAKARLQTALDGCKRTFEIFAGDVIRGREAVSKLETRPTCCSCACQGGNMSRSDPSRIRT